ncbi:hypothetical protein PtA15_7A631 [Puccinia triticina]|uniref:Uncharacterized protein n=1 Tax=Puccinia triticina TaxID=208348 RepID=A0ABY7CR08_9BASI|nr:uncharacterized protein PtA15_7A631 [Puccinia triticina]WAQ86902.1 hypothetical protein PtA15_7A631 [Puccinia triticina]
MHIGSTISSHQHKDPQTRNPKSYKQTFEYCLKAQLNKPFYHHEKMNPCSGNCSCGACTLLPTRTFL